jgi:hypothetical protein
MRIFTVVLPCLAALSIPLLLTTAEHKSLSNRQLVLAFEAHQIKTARSKCRKNLINADQNWRATPYNQYNDLADQYKALQIRFVDIAKESRCLQERIDGLWHTYMPWKTEERYHQEMLRLECECTFLDRLLRKVDLAWFSRA